MKFEEVLPALKAGKKIARKCWSGSYWQINAGPDYSHTPQHLVSEDWEIIEPTVTITRNKLISAWIEAINKDPLPLSTVIPRLELFLREIGL